MAMMQAEAFNALCFSWASRAPDIHYKKSLSPAAAPPLPGVKANTCGKDLNLNHSMDPTPVNVHPKTGSLAELSLDQLNDNQPGDL